MSCGNLLKPAAAGQRSHCRLCALFQEAHGYRLLSHAHNGAAVHPGHAPLALLLSRKLASAGLRLKKTASASSFPGASRKRPLAVTFLNVPL
jgi:hypothetical protein